MHKHKKQDESPGGDRDRTDDLLLAKQALSQLSYGPTFEYAFINQQRYDLNKKLIP